jgi:hypothetical protein
LGATTTPQHGTLLLLSPIVFACKKALIFFKDYSTRTTGHSDKPTMMPLDCRTDSEQEVREQELGSEPFGIGDDAFPVLDIEPTEGELLGIFHHRFEGDREHTQSFLKQFKQFMMMNHNTFIARDPIARCLYFFSLLKGPEAELWVERNDSWLLEVESGPSLLAGKSAWDILEEDFKKSFIDYAGPERAFMDIQKLKMKEDKVDEYIATFKSLGRRAGMNLDDPSALRMFARGLPRKLAEACIYKENPENFEQWAKGAQRQHKCAILRD